MQNPITTLSIENFKSIRKVDLECEDINIFVGRPNSGKSNILEAMALLSGDSVFNPGFFEGTIYYTDTLDDLFYFRNNEKPIRVDTNRVSSRLGFFSEDAMYGYFARTEESELMDSVISQTSSQNAYKKFEVETGLGIEPATLDEYENRGAIIDKNGRLRAMKGGLRYSPVRKYSYKRMGSVDNPAPVYLLPPHGANLLKILQNNPRLQAAAGKLFTQYDLQLVMDAGAGTLRIQRNQNGVVNQLPYTLVADTLRRLIFHLAAVYSNRESVILFEEPEAHTFAPYQSFLAGEIVEDAANQYFIVTHSDYVFEELVRQDKRKVAVFVVWYENHETKARRLTPEEMSNLLKSHASIYMNLDGYVPHE